MSQSNGKKRSQPPVQAKAGSRARRKARRNKPNALPAAAEHAPVARFLRCTLLGQPSNTGMPDGDGRLSIVRNRKYLFTLLPDSTGNLEFVIGATPASVLWQRRGISFFSHKAMASSTNGIGYTTSSTEAVFGSRPFELMDGINPGSATSTNSANSPLGWRVMSLRATVRHTGPPLTASGWVYGKQMNTNVMDRSFPTTGWDHLYKTTQSQTFPSPVDSRSTAGPARDTYSTLLVPRDTKYEIPMRDVLATEADGENKIFGGYWAPHSSLPLAYYNYTGLSPDCRITVEVDLCYQTIVDPDSPLLSFAKPSEMGEPTFLARALTYLSNQPAVKRGLEAFGKHMYDTASRLATNAIYSVAPLALAGL